MSNQEKDPQIFGADGTRAGAGVHLLEPRDVPLGGPRAMRVRRTLPQRTRSFIGAWCFVDHYGPDDVTRTGGMVLPPHPHTGLQTVSWLFAGELEHRDSSGAHAFVRPGELNLMTAGRGIQHSEVSLHDGPDGTRLHGVQLWTVLPDSSRHHEPFFEHHVARVVERPEGTISVFIGALAGESSAATVFSPLLGAQLDLQAGQRLELEVDRAFEHGVLVDDGNVTVNGIPAPVDNLLYLAPGEQVLAFETTEPTRLILLGGTPFGEQIVMWWNFIGRTHDEVVAYRQQWQDEITAGGVPGGRYGVVTGYDGAPLPAPTLPTVRLKPRS